MRLHRSNRTEALVERLVDVVREPLADPLAPECIVVQGRGMERWLAMKLAEHLGVWADPWFPFPRRLLELAFEVARNGTGAPRNDRLTIEGTAVTITQQK